MAKKKRIFYPVVFMILVTAFFTFLLAFLNEQTYARIEEQKALEFQTSVLYSFDLPIEDMNEKELISFYKNKVEERTINDRNYYIYSENGTTRGYVFQFIGDGLWGTISGHIAFDPSFSQLLGVNFTDHSETPGLGGRIDEIEFKEQFRNISITDVEEIIEYGTASGGNVDAISGATSTSTAVKNILNRQIPIIIELTQREGFDE
jgi:Na+-transporting NADH:ubiquinone oxidoreductase subunit C